MHKTTVNDILDFAIAGEKAANQFYLELAAKMRNNAMKKVFEDFAAEERNHKEIIEGVKQGRTVEFEEVADLKIADYTVGGEPRPDMDYQDALILAMKKEKAAFAMYSRLAEVTQDQETRRTFLMLAQEEARHKLRFETEYDQVILKDN
ncbi:MAG TPA: ferritin family protein [Sedimentisphaerales bacterium]|nr:ferritin family protein [Sedimentisphaerales bacterium]